MTTAAAETAPTTTPDPLVTRALGFVDQLSQVKVTRENKAQAELDILTLTDMEKDAHAKFDPICEANYTAWKVSTTTRASVLDPIVATKKRLSKECGAVQAQLEREAEERAALDAAKQAEKDTTATLEHAAALEAAGDKDGAQAALDAVEFAPPVPVAPVAVASETQYRDEWKFVIEDVNALPREYMLPDEKAIRAIGTNLKERAKIPGVRFFKEKTAIGKSGRRS